MSSKPILKLGSWAAAGWADLYEVPDAVGSAPPLSLTPAAEGVEEPRPIASLRQAFPRAVAGRGAGALPELLDAVALGGAQAEADGGTRHRQPVVRRPRHLHDTQHVKIGGKNLWRRRLVFARTGTA